MTSVIVNHDLDSSVAKGLRLLHSSNSDSENQLKQLWRQSVLEKYGTTRVPTSVLHKIHIPSPTKRLFDEEHFYWETEHKKLKPENLNGSQKSFSSTPNPYSSYSAEDIVLCNSSGDRDKDSIVEMFTVDGVCVKCKASFSVNNNKLVECVGCQKHYHQLCHFPPIRDTDLSDPRFVWYCFSCEENITATTMNEKMKNPDTWSPSKSSNSAKSVCSGALFSNNISSSNINSKLMIDNTKHITAPSNMYDRKKKSSKKHSTRKLEKRKHTK